jgi:hypothetical protein
MVDPIKVIYIAGDGRSGSTLLARMLGAIPGFVCLGEVVHLWERGFAQGEPCGCGLPVPDCPFWAEVLGLTGCGESYARRMLELRRRIDRQRFIPFMLSPPATPEFRRLLREYTEGLTLLYTAALRAANARVVVDSSKHASTAFALRGAAGLDLCVVHLVRDSRGVVNSWMRSVERPGPGGRTVPMPRYGAAKGALRWMLTNVECHALQAFGAPVVRVRYESLVESPRFELNRVLRAAGSDVEDALLPLLPGARVRVRTDHSAAGNPMRFRNEPLELRRDDAWQWQMPSRSRRLVNFLTWPLLAHYGYGKASSPAVKGSSAVEWAAHALGAQPLHGGQPPSSAVKAYGWLPSAARPRQLVPLSSRRDAAAVFASASIGDSVANRASRRLTTASLRAGVLQPLLRDRLVATTGSTDAASLLAHLSDATGLRIENTGVRFGTSRQNTKPVLQLLGPGGRLLGYAKVGWNNHTNELVEAEAEALERLAAVRFRVLVVPRLLYWGRWGDAAVVVQSPLDVRRTWMWGRANTHHALALRELASVFPSEQVQLRQSAYVANVNTTIGRLRDDSGLRGQVADAWHGALEKYGGRKIVLGTSHGDFSPWNTAITRAGLAVWDWERSRDGAPVAFDAFHYHLEASRARAARREPFSAVVAAMRVGAGTWLARSAGRSVDDVDVEMYTELYLIARVLRHISEWDLATPRTRILCRDLLDYLGHRRDSDGGFTTAKDL